MRVSSEIIETTQSLAENLITQYIELEHGYGTTIHTARYAREHVVPRLVSFDTETYLSNWCKEQSITDALVGGFFLRSKNMPLGDFWQNGQQVLSEPFSEPWGKLRGSIHIDAHTLTIDHRHLLPKAPSGDLLQAGPMLVRDGEISASVLTDFEGFSRGSHQFDSDITIERHPRAAIGISKDHIWSVVCDGRTAQDSGMFLHEMAAYMRSLGCTHALNLDGGGSASLISNSELINRPRGIDHSLLIGRPIYSAIVFEQR